MGPGSIPEEEIQTRETQRLTKTYQSQRKRLQKGGWGKATAMNRAMPRDRLRLRNPWETERERTDKLGKERDREIPHWGESKTQGKRKRADAEKWTTSLTLTLGPAQTLPSLGRGSGQHPPPAASSAPPALRQKPSWQVRERIPLRSEVLGSPRLALQCSGPRRGHIKVTG